MTRARSFFLFLSERKRFFFSYLFLPDFSERIRAKKNFSFVTNYCYLINFILKVIMTINYFMYHCKLK